MLWVLVLGAILIWAPSPTITHRTNGDRGHAQIKPKPCSVNGVEGTCMFVYECIKTDGKHVGMCVDNFMFGSCCSHNLTQNTIPSHHHHHHQSRPTVLYSSSHVNSSPRPPSFPLNLRPHSQSSSASSIVSKVRPSKPVNFITKTTKRPPLSAPPTKTASTTTTSTTTTTTTAAAATAKPTSMGRPWTNKPPHFVTSLVRPNGRPPHPSVKYPSRTNSSGVVTQTLVVRPVNSSLYGNGLPSTGRPPFASVYDLVATSKPTPPANATTTKATASAESDTASSVTESGVGHHVSSWLTSKPSWLGSPSANEIHTSSKPVPPSSKPEYWSSGKPNAYISRPWQPSTETVFVTRPRPSSNMLHRPKPTRKPVTLDEDEISTSLSSDTSSVAWTATTTTTTTTTTRAITTTTTTKAATSTATTSATTTTTTTTTSAPVTSTGSATTETPVAETSSSTTVNPGMSKYQYSGQCGVAALSPRPEMRIVGGKNAPFGGWPWQVSVRRTSFFGFSSTHRCGGAVINENWIATAGHCVDDLLTSQIRIRVGEYDFSSVMEPYPFVERAVSKKVVHPKYNFFTYEYDLALVRLDSPLEFQPHISPICLPASDDLLIGENATVTGWGRLSEGGTLPSVLQQVSVPIVSNDKCKSMFLRAGRHEFIPEIFLCAGYENGGQDSCQGDSGGPLQVKGKNGRYFLAGIISWGIGCAEANLPGVCTRISKFVPWILENVT